jgi:hypothetical protein
VASAQKKLTRPPRLPLPRGAAPQRHPGPARQKRGCCTQISPPKKVKGAFPLVEASYQDCLSYHYLDW